MCVKNWLQERQRLSHVNLVTELIGEPNEYPIYMRWTEEVGIYGAAGFGVPFNNRHGILSFRTCVRYSSMQKAVGPTCQTAIL